MGNTRERSNALWGLNIGVFTMSISGLFAKLLPWPSSVIIAGRMLLSAPMLLLYLLATKQSIRLTCTRDMVILFVLGVLLALHWITFFESAQVSTVAIAVVTVFTFPLITTFLEPLFRKEQLLAGDVVIAVIVFGGILLIAGDLSAGADVRSGITLGLLSALCMALRNVFSEAYVRQYSGSVVMFWQLTAGTIVLLPVLWFSDFTVTLPDLGKLFILAAVATAFSHTIVLAALAHVPARTSGVLSSVQPLYSTVLAALLLGEIPSVRVIVGAIIIVGAVVAETMRTAR